MKCRVTSTAKSDLMGKVSPESFYANVDHSDLECRKSATVEDWYCSDWFFEKDGELWFTPPAFHFRRGRLLGINGRHRAVLLARHMKEFPMIFVLPDTWPKEKISEIMLNELCDGSIIELPNLPIIGSIAHD